MKTTYKKISHVIVLGLMLLFFAPSVVKFSHLFEDHKHEACHHPKKLHYHEIDLDCEFYKFKLNQEFNFTIFNVDLVQNSFERNENSTYDKLIANQSTQYCSLRGPPVFVMYT